MDKAGLLVVTADPDSGSELCSLLEGLNYQPSLCPSLNDVESHLKQPSVIAVILDLDNLDLDPRVLRQVRSRYPQLHLLGISALSYHPELEEIIGSYFVACLLKPLDVEELTFWLKCISEHSEPVEKF